MAMAILNRFFLYKNRFAKQLDAHVCTSLKGWKWNYWQNFLWGDVSL